MSTHHDWNSMAVALAEGDVRIAEAFAREVGGWLRAVMGRGLPEGEDYEQAALDLLTEIVVSLDKFDPERGSFRAWAGFMASRRLADFYRRRERYNAAEPGKRETAHRDKYHLRERADEDTRREMAEAISGLEHADLELLRLFFDEKLPDSEVAERLEISADNARQRKKRLVDRLHHQLKQTLGNKR